MCLDVDCEYEIISGPDWRKARKPHRCDECRRAIDPGERYYRYAMKEWGERSIREQRMCAHCRSTIEVGAAMTGCPMSWWWEKVHDLEPDEGGFVGDILVNHDLTAAQRAVMLRQVVRRNRGWRRRDGSLYPLPAAPAPPTGSGEGTEHG